MSKSSPLNPEAHLVQLERRIKDKEAELAFLLGSNLPLEIKKLKNELEAKSKQIEDIAKNTGNSSSGMIELAKMKSYTEDLKKLEITKDLQISKLNEQLLSKDKEIGRLNQSIKDIKPEDFAEKEKELITTHQQTINQLHNKINDLELKIYKINDDKKQGSLENFKLQERIHELEQEIAKREIEKTEEPIIDPEPEHISTENANIINEICNDEKCVPKETHEKILQELNTIKNDFDNLTANNINLNEQLESFKNQTNKQSTDNEDNHKKDIQYIKAKHEAEINKKEKAYQKLNEENARLINEYLLKIKEYEAINKNLTHSLKQANQAKNDLEDVIIKQEDKVNNLGEKVNKIEQLLKNKNNELQENETYSFQLMNIVNDQKKQIATIRNQHKEIDSTEITSLQMQLDVLKEAIQARDTTIIQLQKNHKSLQDKYFKLSADKRKKPQEDLLNQAKEMKNQKIERDRERNRSSNHKSKPSTSNSRSSTNNNNNIHHNEEKKVIVASTEAIPPQIISKYQLQQSPYTHDLPIPSKNHYCNNNNIISNPINSNSNSTLPIIQQQKQQQHINRQQDKSLLNMMSLGSSSLEDTKMEEINNMMRKIIDEC